MNETPYYQDEQVTLLLGDAVDVLRTLPDASVDCVVTSPPYWKQRDYGTPGQYGLESTPAAYVETMRAVFHEARRVLADDGTLWLNLGDKYGPDKQLLMIPERVAIRLQDDGWTLRNKIAWNKVDAQPESVADRLSSRHEMLFLLSKAERYWFDLDAIREPHTMRPQRRSVGRWADQVPRPDGVNPQTFNKGVRAETAVDGHPLGRNPGDVWAIPTARYPGAHFAVMPLEMATRSIKAGCRPGGTVLDPFSGAGTTGAAARQLGRKYVGIDLNAEYHELAKARFAQTALGFDTTPAA